MSPSLGGGFSWRSCAARRGGTLRYARIGLAALTAAAAAYAGAVPAAHAQEQSPLGPTCPHVPLPTDKLSCKVRVPPPHKPVVLVACGSFNPPTVLHMRMFDLAAHELNKRGYDVWGGYLSPVGDAYAKPGLAAASDRIAMCQEASSDNPLVMTDAWEAQQVGYTRTLTVLRHVQRRLHGWLTSAGAASEAAEASLSGAEATISSSSSNSQAGPPRPHAGAGTLPANKGQAHGTGASGAANTSSSHSRGDSNETVRVMLLCGADVLASMASPGVWVAPEVVLAEHGVVCVAREGTDLEPLLSQPGSVLSEHRHNIIVVFDHVGNSLSSSKVRQEVAAGRPVRYLVADGVMQYMQRTGLYSKQAGSKAESLS